MTVLNTGTGKVISTVPIGEGVDGGGFDEETGLAFSSSGDGTLTIARQSSSGTYEVVENVATQRGSRTMAIDPTTGNIYLPAAEFAPPAASAEGAKPRPVMIKDSFSVLVVGK